MRQSPGRAAACCGGCLVCEMDTAAELVVLCRAILLGGGLGLVYDLMRVVRRRLPLPGVEGVLDLSFWILATTGLFLFSQEAWNGRVRLYGAVFCFMGGAAYFWGLSPVFLGLFFRLADIFSFALGILLFPARALGKILRRIEKNVKTPFSFKGKWSMIGSKPKG